MNARILARHRWAAILLAALCLLSKGPAPAAEQQAPTNSITAAEVAEFTRLGQKLERLRGQGKYEEAIPLAIARKRVAEKVLGPDHPGVAQTLTLLAELYYQTADYAHAGRLYKRALDIRKKVLGFEHPDVATNLNDLAWVYDTQGDYARAEPLYKRALAIRQEVLRPNHPDVANSLNNLAWLFQAKGEYARAEPLFQRALRIREKVLGPEHPDVATSLENLGALYDVKGDYASAEPLLRRALRIREKVLDPNHLYVANSLNNLAHLYHTKGDYARAERSYGRALAIRKKALGPNHAAVAETLNNLAALYVDKGDYAHAERLHKRALAIRKKVLGPAHRDVATSLNNLAELYRAQGNYKRAEPLYRRALTLREKALGAGHSDVATSLNNLAVLYDENGHNTRARALHERALEIREEVLGPNHSDVASSLNNLAGIYQEQGDYDRAESLYKRALVIGEKALGREHPTVREFVLNLGVNSWAQGKTLHASELFTRATAIRERNLGLGLATGSEDEKRAYVALLVKEYHGTMSLHLMARPHDLQAARLALTTLLQIKGRVLDATAASMISLRQRLSSESQVLLDTRARSQPVTLERVQEAIPAGAALVELAAYQPYNPAKEGRQHEWADSRYAAYVLHPKGEPLWVDLGKAEAVDQTINDLRSGLRDPNSFYVARIARELDELVMRPIRKLLGEARMVLLSPDGALNLVPFGAFIDEHNRYLIERYTFTYLTTGRDLLRLQVKGHGQGQDVVIANPDYDSGGERDPTRVTQAEQNNENLRSVDFMTLETFDRLRGTASEGQAIGKILDDAVVLTGRLATESSLKQVKEPSVLHVATHGFFLIDQPEPLAGQLGDNGFTRGLRTENPLLRSGLALAGANGLQSGAEDGVLTALEAANLDLWGTELVTLSACETGVGDVENGEGVYGLRRALVLAGSESQVMSLWKVDDDATKDLMVDYYRRLVAGEGRSEALRQVQFRMLKSKDRSHPYYWASFIPSGEWASLKDH